MCVCCIISSKLESGAQTDDIHDPATKEVINLVLVDDKRTQVCLKLTLVNRSENKQGPAVKFSSDLCDKVAS